MKRKTLRNRTFTLLGIAIKFYNYGEEYDIRWVNYRRMYDARVSIAQMWEDARDSIDGQLYAYSAYIDMSLSIPIPPIDPKYYNAYSGKTNGCKLDIPERYQFDGEINIGYCKE